MTVRVTSDALDDLQDGYGFYEKQEKGLGSFSVPISASASSKICWSCAALLAFTARFAATTM